MDTLLVVTNQMPYEIWEIYYMEDDLIGRKMEDVALETFTKYRKVPKKIAVTLVNDIELLCEAMNDLLEIKES